MRISAVVIGDKDWKHKIEKLFADAKTTAAVGLFSGSTAEGGAEIIKYAVHNEFGTKRIPARPFMRHTLATRRAHWYKLMHTLLASGKYDPRAALMLVAETAVKDIQLTIETAGDGAFVPSAAKTIERKKARGKRYPDKPLIDTGAMQEAVTYEMRDRDAG